MACYLCRVVLYAITCFAVLVPPVRATTIMTPSGGDDTARLQSACDIGPVRLATDGHNGTFLVSEISCSNLTSENATADFWYEGQQPTVKLQGISGTVRGVLTCPSPGPCLYESFEVNPPAAVAGIVIDSVHDARLIEMSVIDDGGGNSGDCVDLTSRAGGMNQHVVISGGSYVHCGGWCINSDYPGSTSDSTFSPFNLMNCQRGGLHLSYGDGNHIMGARIQDMYTQPGIQIDTGVIDIIEGNTFDQNFSDMVLGGDGSGGAYIVSGNFSCRLQGGAMIDLSGFIGAITGGHNLGCDPTYRVAPGTTFGRVGFYDFFPTYADPHSQAVLSEVMR